MVGIENGPNWVKNGPGPVRNQSVSVRRSLVVMKVSLERWKSVFYSGACIRLNIIKILLITLKQRNGKYRTIFLLEIKLLMGK